MTTDHAQKFDDATICRLVRESLALLNRLNPGLRSVRAKGVRIDDTSILVDFYAESRDMLSVKAEIAGVTGALSGLLGTDELSERPILHYGIRAWENDENWLVYAVCSAETAKKVGRGSALDWLRGTEFQENTADWRLARAKSLTSRVEIGLRDVIDHLLSQGGDPSWWGSLMVGNLSKIRADAERQARKAGVRDPSPRELLDYTYLRDLAQIVLELWSHFGSIWGGSDTFAKRMDRLNALRRSEAHNRPTSRQELAELESLHDQILDGIARPHPQVVPLYLAEKWRLSLLRLAEKLRDSWGPEEVRRDVAENAARLAAFQRTSTESISELEEMQVPVGRHHLHQQLLEAVRLSATSAQRMLDAFQRSDLTTLEEAAGQFAVAMTGIREFEEAFLLTYN